MSDLNLIPQEVKFRNTKKIKRIKYVVLSSILLGILIAGACIPVYLIYEKEKENKYIQEQINNLSYVSGDINKLNTQKKVMQDRINLMNSLFKDEIKWTNVIRDISSIIPKEISVVMMDSNNSDVSMKCISSSYKAIAVFVANLENSQKYNSVKLNNIIPSNGNFEFNLSFTINNLNNKEK